MYDVLVFGPRPSISAVVVMLHKFTYVIAYGSRLLRLPVYDGWVIRKSYWTPSLR